MKQMFGILKTWNLSKNARTIQCWYVPR